MTNQFMGYTFHRPTELRPNTILFSREDQTITVSMAQKAVEYIISVIAKKNPIIERYNIASKVLRAIQARLANGQARKPNKKDVEVACDVLNEILKENAVTEEQKDRIDAAAFQCKLLIECFVRD